MSTISDIKVDRKALSVTTVEAAGSDAAYWLSVGPHERLRAVEVLRKLNYGEDRTAARLQRVLEVAQRPRG